ncbi:MAG: hypothetical protein HC771_12720 [Synechococcales cyanobacterium CRU_2_2]|nr:hypothetical protein [Synechococcales cyanobacterium CRU_2_2]
MGLDSGPLLSVPELNVPENESPENKIHIKCMGIIFEFQFICDTVLFGFIFILIA